MVRFGAALACLLVAGISAPALADPPPWAPAHGYRAKHGGREVIAVERPVYAAPYGIGDGGCNREVLGAALGGVAGGVAGSTIGKGDGRVAATIGGAIVGILIGGAIGRSMDQTDQNCAGQALEYARDNQRVAWKGPRGDAYEMRPARSWRTAQGLFCREYQTSAMIGGKRQQLFGTACREPDGAWRLTG